MCALTLHNSEELQTQETYSQLIVMPDRKCADTIVNQSACFTRERIFVDLWFDKLQACNHADASPLKAINSFLVYRVSSFALLDMEQQEQCKEQPVPHCKGMVCNITTTILAVRFK